MKRATGVELIAAERQRQIDKEDWTPAHDDQHICEQMALAAACYALPHETRQREVWNTTLIKLLWPWGSGWWKPCSRREGGRLRELVKAGALIAAEIDRLQRISIAKGTVPKREQNCKA
jgi:hypothetical protein